MAIKNLIFIIAFALALPAFANDCDRELIGLDQAALRAYRIYSDSKTGFLAMSNPAINHAAKSCGHACMVNLVQMLRLASGQDVLENPAAIVNEINKNPSFQSGLTPNSIAVVAQDLIAKFVERKTHFSVKANQAIVAHADAHTSIVSEFNFDDVKVDPTTGQILIFIALAPDGAVRGAHAINILRRVADTLMVSDPNYPEHIFRWEMIRATLRGEPAIRLHPREAYLEELYGDDAVYLVVAIATAKIE